MSNSKFNIINTIGFKYFVKNLETDEFSYPKALKSLGKRISKKEVEVTKIRNLGKKSLKEVIDKVVKDGMTNYEKELAIHDWMAENPDMLPAKAFARFVPAAFTSSSDSTDVTDPVRATFF